MCGICGIYNRTPQAVDRELLGAMTGSLAHRGPDGEGTFCSGRIGLGHRRLSIIDLGGGAQPMTNEDRSLHIVFNGEIYNYLELRAELSRSGHVFATASDTEVILHAYEQWGDDCITRFNGMFAIALWDEPRKRLLLARDHLGIKPLYYTVLDRMLLFASEIKALLVSPDCPRAVDVKALADLFMFRYVPSPDTLFAGIKKIPPGHRMIIDAAGQRIERFWQWLPCIRQAWTEESLIEEYQQLVADAVRLQMRSDVPVGLFLSSGVDSSALLAIMSALSDRPVHTFTIGFEDGARTNETDDARAFARSWGADHTDLMIGPGDYEAYYERYLGDIEEPVGNETAAAFYFVSRLASEKVKVALTGQGADEPWAGYDRYLGAKLSAVYSLMPRLVSRRVAALVQRIPGRFERLKRGALSLHESDMLTRFAKMYSFFSPELKHQLFRGALADRIAADENGAKESLRRLQSDVGHLDPVTQMLYIDTRASLPDDLLMVGDKTSMANSLEARVPFLDVRVIEFIETLPASLKLNGLTGKYLHKKALEKWLPRTMVYRKKKGFANPVEDWFRSRMQPFVDDCLLDPNAALARYFDQATIRQMLQRDRDGRDQFRRHLYLLVSFELWHRTFIKN